MLEQLALNADLGEGSLNDEALMPYLTRCSIACGGHYGDRESIDRTISSALHHQVKIGAHPSYPDRENFGRAALEVSQEKLMESLAAQLQLMIDRCQQNEASLEHIKPHGKFYNDLFRDRELANAWLNLLEQIFPEPKKILVAGGSAVHLEAEERKFPYLIEAFADRNYNDDGSLVSRDQPNAMLTDKNAFKDRLVRSAKGEPIKSVNEKPIDIRSDTLCVHSDSDHVVENLKFVFDHEQGN